MNMDTTRPNMHLHAMHQMATFGYLFVTPIWSWVFYERVCSIGLPMEILHPFLERKPSARVPGINMVWYLLVVVLRKRWWVGVGAGWVGVMQWPQAWVLSGLRRFTFVYSWLGGIGCFLLEFVSLSIYFPGSIVLSFCKSVWGFGGVWEAHEFVISLYLKWDICKKWRLQCQSKRLTSIHTSDTFLVIDSPNLTRLKK